MVFIMSLYDILSNRTAVRILKLLENNERINKSYSLSLAQVMHHLGLFLKPKNAIRLLKAHGLLIVEEGEEHRMGITEKGKKFVALIDELIFLIQNKTEKRTMPFEIRYDLTPSEKRILLVLSKMQQEIGNSVQLKNLMQELYPHNNYLKKQSSISKELSKLEALHLVEKTRQGRFAFLRATDSGIRVVREQIEREA